MIAAGSPGSHSFIAMQPITKVSRPAYPLFDRHAQVIGNVSLWGSNSSTSLNRPDGDRRFLARKNFAA
jgi:hypothetical protein